jgi:OmpA-OmpF porin, OOP family
MVRLNFLATFVIAATLGLAAPLSVSAGSDTEMTSEEIAAAFLKQQQQRAFLKQQKTRGLVIVPSGQQPADSESGSTVATALADDEYNAVDKGSQVNVQIAFDFDSASLRKDQEPKLVALCNAMKAVDASAYQIIGHTDSSGTAAYNERLSLLRAQEVKHYLVNSCGIDEDRLKAIGMGETVPFDADDPAADSNRRVEFQALG